MFALSAVAVRHGEVAVALNISMFLKSFLIAVCF